jgi:HSP20 family protein
VKELIPAPAFSNLRKEADRFLERVREGDAFEIQSASDWIPNVEFMEKPEAYHVTVEVPGIDPKDIEVLFDNGLLTVRGQKIKTETEDRGARYYRSERSYGSFVRNLRMPATVDGKQITASFQHGVLTILLPKTAETRGQAIPIKIN